MVNAEPYPFELVTSFIVLIKFIELLKQVNKVNSVTGSDSAKIEGLSAVRNPTVFAWKNEIDVPAKSEFVLYKISSDGTARKVHSVLNPKGGVKIERLTEGNYRWQVIASTSDGIPLDSSKNEFSVSEIPLLSAPSLVLPKNNFVIGNPYLKKNKFISYLHSTQIF